MARIHEAGSFFLTPEARKDGSTLPPSADELERIARTDPELAAELVQFVDLEDDQGDTDAA